MLATLDLIDKQPKDALVEVINYHNQTQLQADNVELGAPSSVDGGELTAVLVKAKPPPNEFVTRQYKGEKEIQYHRLDLATYFANEQPSVEHNLPVASQTIAQQLAQEYGFVVDDSDFVEELVTADNYQDFTLKAKTGSLRWIGEVAVTIEIPAVPLSDLVDTTRLDGFQIQPVDADIAMLVQQTQLNGFYPAEVTRTLASILTETFLDGFGGLSLRDEITTTTLDGLYLEEPIPDTAILTYNGTYLGGNSTTGITFNA